jgi:hypothetical protein
MLDRNALSPVVRALTNLRQVQELIYSNLCLLNRCLRQLILLVAGIVVLIRLFLDCS